MAAEGQQMAQPKDSRKGNIRVADGKKNNSRWTTVV
jgi:hypothetical protein